MICFRSSPSGRRFVNHGGRPTFARRSVRGSSSNTCPSTWWSGLPSSSRHRNVAPPRSKRSSPTRLPCSRTSAAVAFATSDRRAHHVADRRTVPRPPFGHHFDIRRDGGRHCFTAPLQESIAVTGSQAVRGVRVDKLLRCYLPWR